MNTKIRHLILAMLIASGAMALNLTVCRGTVYNNNNGDTETIIISGNEHVVTGNPNANPLPDVTLERNTTVIISGQSVWDIYPAMVPANRGVAHKETFTITNSAVNFHGNCDFGSGNILSAIISGNGQLNFLNGVRGLGQATFTVSGNAGLNVLGGITGAGNLTMTISGNSAVNVSGGISGSGNSSVTISGNSALTVGGAFPALNTITASGNSQVTIDGNIASGASLLATGNSSIRVNGNLTTWTTGGALAVSGTHAQPQLNVSGAVSVGGSLNLVLVSTAAQNGTLVLFHADGGITGSFNSIVCVNGDGHTITVNATLSADGKDYVVAYDNPNFGLGGDTDNMLTLTPASHSVPATASSLNVSIMSNVAWTMSKDAAWLALSLSLSGNSGTLIVNVAANPGAERIGTVTFSGDGITKTVTITQAAAASVATLSVTPESYGAAATASSLSVSVTSNMAWTVSSSAAWLTPSSSSGSNNGSVTVNYSANTSTTARTGTLTFSGGGITKTVTVIQDASAPPPPSATLSVTPAIYSAAATASSLSVSVTSNVAWTVSSSAAWLTPSSSSGSNNGNVTVNYSANTSTTARTGTLTFSSGGITRTVAVTQAAAGTQPPPVTETWDLAGLTSKGLKLSASVAVPKGVKLAKGTKAVYTWQRDGVTIATGTAKTFTVKGSGTYTLTLSYTTADGQRHSQTQNFGTVKLFAQPKTVTLSLAQTTDTITNSALRATSVVSGESLKLTASVGTVGGGAVGPFRYVWYCGSAVVRTQESTSTTDIFTTPAYGDKAVGYKCVVELVAKDAKNKPLATAKSKDLKAKIILPPSAVTLSASATTVNEGGTLTLSATAKGTAPLLFTWYKNGAQIASGSAKKFAKKPVSASDAGTYYVVVSQSQTTRRAQSASVVVNIQRADGSIVSGAQSQSALMAASSAESVSTTASASSVEPRRQDAAGTLSNSVLNQAPLSLSAGYVLTVSGSATREYIIVNETQHSTGAYHYEWRDSLTAEFQDIDAEAQLTLRFITGEGGVYELNVSGSVGETGTFELHKK